MTAPTGDTVAWVDPEDFVVTHLTGKDRAFWLDGTGARPWSGRFSYVGWLGPDDVSLAYDATAQTVSCVPRRLERGRRRRRVRGARRTDWRGG